ncbi:hypothetical protein SELMODRAFT_448158 [Selaginella moellendorffii]|uniref:Uncharacterized protein n=1 Tax=Selaginella moellendorffii TaxID=88036 RepID=D8T572_SELML|nr:protein sym-1 [Selaginella moellendorffii]EFJ08210.1 hypothetical protein SELMODRAFT_448158 [Selaginella moellendorffii]|eukprot:XP_002990761.1 protein sym-1 [Selaginella moellendorffii]
MAAGRAWSWYRSQLAARPVRTQAIVSGILWGSGDVIAQKINASMQDDDEERPIDLKRTAACCIFGLGFVGPAGHYWYQGLDRFVKKKLLLTPNSPRFIVAKLVPDALLEPVHLGLFFSLMGFTAGKPSSQVFADVKRDIVPALVSGGMVWPLLQAVNFRFVPVEHQLLYLNSLCLLESAFLSWVNKQEDAAWKKKLMAFITPSSPPSPSPASSQQEQGQAPSPSPVSS